MGITRHFNRIYASLWLHLEWALEQPDFMPHSGRTLSTFRILWV